MIYRNLFTIGLIVAGLLVSGTGFSARLMQDDMDDVGGNWQYWTGHFDQGGHVAAGRVVVSDGKLRFPLPDFAVIVTTDEFNRNIELVADVAINASPANSFFTLGLSGSTAPGSIIDCDLYEDGGQLYIGVYFNGNYGTSGVLLNPQPTLGTEYKMHAQRTGDDVTVTLTTLDGLTTLGTTTRTCTDAFRYGMLYVKCLGMQATVDNLTVTDSDTAQVDFFDDFGSSDLADILAKWFAEPNPDVNEGGGGGMRIYNMASVPNPDRLSRPSFQQVPGFMSLRAVAPDGYARVPSRYAPPHYNWFGNIDLMIMLRLDEGAAEFSVGLDNRSNEGQRRAVLLNSATTGTMNGVSNPSLHVMNNAHYPNNYNFSSSVSLNGIWNPDTTPDIYLYVQRNGDSVTTWIGTAPGGAQISGSQVTGSIAGANASGQLVPTIHAGIAKIGQLAVWDFGTGWTLPVENWTEY